MNNPDDFTIFEALLLIVFAVSMRFFTTFIHELGHAIPALIYTKGKVRVYVGSYGNIEAAKVFYWRRLKFFIKFNSFEWGRGVCAFEDNASLTRIHHFIITLGGPFISLVFSLLAILPFLLSWENSAVNFILLMVSVSSFWDFVINIFPSHSPIELDSGEKIMSDGYVLLQLLKSKKSTEF